MRNQTSAAVVSQAGHTHRMQTPYHMHAARMIGTTSGAAKSATSIGHGRREDGQYISIVPSSLQACKAGAPTMPTAPSSTSRRPQHGGTPAIESGNKEGHGGHCRAPQLQTAQVTALPL